MNDSARPVLNVLVVSYFFPPYSDSGVYRTAKFTKYMSSFGCKPFVLTSGDPYALNEDESLLKDIPAGTPVYRAGSLIPMRLLRGARQAFVASRSVESRFSLKSALGLFLRKTFRSFFVSLFIPDIMATWAPLAYRMGREILEREKMNVIFATDPPSDYLVARALSARYTVPLVVDFRDAWTLRQYGNIARGAFRKKIEQKMESGVLRHASRVIFVNSYMRRKYASDYPEYSAKFCEITNGYDEDDFTQSENEEQKTTVPFTILHAGRISEFQNPVFLFQAIRALADENEISPQTFQLVFTGDFTVLRRQAIKNMKLEDYVQNRSYMPHSAVVKEMMAADALLLITGEDAEITTGKLYEYLAANRPVLALAPLDGEASRLIKNAEAGFVVRYNDVDAIKTALRDVMRCRKSGSQWTNRREVVSRFTRKTLTQKLCGILHEAAGECSRQENKGIR